MAAFDQHRVRPHPVDTAGRATDVVECSYGSAGKRFGLGDVRRDQCGAWQQEFADGAHGGFRQ